MSKPDKRNHLPEGDDGRTIADMNVEGMPWYRPRRPEPAPPGGQEEMTKKQLRTYTASALKAGLLVAGVMSLGLVLFAAFCVFVWFR